MPDVNLREFERMRNGGARTSVRVQPSGTAVAGYQVPLGNRPSIRDVGVVGAPAWTAEQSETWVRTSVSATCPRRLTVFEGGKKDIEKCWEFGDDFDGSALNTGKWVNRSSGGAVSVAGSILTMNVSSGTSYAQIDSVRSFGAGYRLLMRLQDNNITTIGSWGFKTGGAGTFRFATSNNIPGHYTVESVVSAVSVMDLGTGYTGYHTWEIARTLTPSNIFVIDGAIICVETTQTSLVASPIGLLAYSAQNTISSEWIMISKYAVNEPVAGTAQPSALNRSMCQSLNLADGLRACCA